MKAPGFKLEKDRQGSTLRQKVRFILKARGRRQSEIDSAQDTADMIQHGVGEIARSVYMLGALHTHVAATRRAKSSD